MYICLGRTEDRQGWFISSENGVRVYSRDEVRRSILDNGLSIVNVKMGANHHVEFKRVYADGQFADYKFLCRILDTRAQVDIINIVYETYFKLDKTNYDEYVYFRDLLDRIIRLYYAYMEDLPIKRKVHNTIEKNYRGYLDYLSDYVHNGSENSLLNAYKVFLSIPDIYTIVGGVMVRDFLGYVYTQIYKCMNKRAKIPDIDLQFVTNDYRAKVYKNFYSYISTRATEVCNLIGEHAKDIDRICTNLLNIPDSTIHENTFANLISDEKITLEVKDKVEAFIEMNKDNKESDFGFTEFLQVSSELVGEAIPGVSGLSIILEHVPRNRLKEFKESIYKVRFLQRFGDTKVYDQLCQLYYADEGLFYYYCNFLDYATNRKKVYSKMHYKRLQRGYFKEINKYNSTKAASCAREAISIMQNNLYSFKIWCDYTLRLDSRIFLDVLLFDNLRLSSHRKFFCQMYNNMGTQDIMNWWLKALYILKTYVHEEYRYNKSLFGTILREYIHMDIAKGKKHGLYLKLKLEDIDELIRTWLGLPDKFWEGVNIDQCLK